MEESMMNPIDQDKDEAENEDENNNVNNDKLNPKNGIKIGLKTVKNRNLQDKKGIQEIFLKTRELQQGVHVHAAVRTDRLLLTVLTRAVDDSGWVEGAAETSTSTSTSILSALTPHFITIVL